VAKW